MLTSLRSKILAGFFTIVAVNVAFGLWTIYQLADVGESTVDLVASTYELNATAARLVSIVDVQIDVLRAMYAQRDRSDAIHRFEQGRDEFRILLLDLSTRGLGHGRARVVTEISSASEQFNRVATSYRLILGGLVDGSAGGYFADSVEPAALLLKQSCFEMLPKNPVELAEVRGDIDRNIRRSLVFVIAGTIVATLLGLVGGSFYSRWVVRPIEQLTQAARSVAGGRFDSRILIASNDELGDLSFEFNRMMERLRSFEEMNIEQLLLEKRKVEAIVQSLATPIVVVDSTMHILLINPAAVELLRLDIGRDYIGVNMAQVVGDTALLPPLQRAVSAGSDDRGNDPFVYVRPSEGRDRFYAVAALPLATTSTVQGAVAVFSDITHFKELDRLKSDFLAKVSHEFRTPLASIVMTTDILREGLLGDLSSAQRDLLDSCKEDCRRLSKLITDILELSRIESRRITRRVQRIDLSLLLSESLKPHHLLAREKGIQLECSVSDGTPEVWGDREEFLWVINNLVSNAIRHTSEGGQVSVSAHISRGRLELEVRDNGEGIPLEDLTRVFERFHQVGSGSVSTPGSVGLGLALVKEVVDGYGGKVSVSSEVGKGTAFVVRIPLENLAPPQTNTTNT